MRRPQSKRSPMLLRMMVRAAVLRKGSAISALTATIIAAAAATAMLNLFVDVQAKLRKEFRNFGANTVIEAPNGQSFGPDSLQEIQSVVDGRGLAVPFAYTVARGSGDQPVV